MKIIDASYTFINPTFDVGSNFEDYAKDIYQIIELAGRTCYKSENRISTNSAERFVRAIIGNNHEAMLEHASMTVKFIVDRGVANELVRHRIASFAQESTRYCDYSTDKFDKHVTFIKPYYFKGRPSHAYIQWLKAMEQCETSYFELRRLGCSPEEARAVLPLSTKTEIVMTANMREWRHFFKLRAAGLTGTPHPQMLEVAVPLLNDCHKYLPALFDDIKPMPCYIGKEDAFQ